MLVRYLALHGGRAECVEMCCSLAAVINQLVHMLVCPSGSNETRLKRILFLVGFC